MPSPIPTPAATLRAQATDLLRDALDDYASESVDPDWSRKAALCMLRREALIAAQAELESWRRWNRRVLLTLEEGAKR
jgi:hypothetical protein